MLYGMSAHRSLQLVLYLWNAPARVDIDRLRVLLACIALPFHSSLALSFSSSPNTEYYDERQTNSSRRQVDELDDSP
jgi:hypothetical protein